MMAVAAAWSRLAARASFTCCPAVTHPAVRPSRWSSDAVCGAGSLLRPSYWHQPGEEPLLPLTLGQVVASAAERWPQREAIVSVHQGQRLTFKETIEQVDRLAAALYSIGLRPGDRIGVCGPNSIEWYITNLAAARAGLIFVNINPAYQEAELEYCLSKAKVKALIIPEKFKTQNYPELIMKIDPEIKNCRPGDLESKKLPYLKSMIILGNSDLSCGIKYNDLTSRVGVDDVQKIHRLQRDIQPDYGCNLQFTSGTTGKPKGTVLSHHNIVNNSYFTGRRLKFYRKHHRICLQVPFFHCFGNVLGIAIALHHGSTLVLPSYSFNPEESIKTINNERCSVIYGTPTMYVDIISKSEEMSTAFSSVEFVITAGSPAPSSLFRKIAKTFSVRKCYSVYGMTETSPLSFVPDEEDSFERCSNTVGRVMDHCEVKVVDEKGRMVPMGQPGELLVRGYPTMLYYYQDYDKTREVMGPDRWLRTGDQFILQDDGYGQVVGRIKDMIIRGGENIFPREIEDIILIHDDVEDAQVIGVPDERLGEDLCACIRLKSGRKTTAKDIQDFCKGKIAHFKIPKYIKFMSDYPRTPSGKIQKFKLREKVLMEGL